MWNNDGWIIIGNTSARKNVSKKKKEKKKDDHSIIIKWKLFGSKQRCAGGQAH